MTFSNDTKKKASAAKLGRVFIIFHFLFNNYPKFRSKL